MITEWVSAGPGRGMLPVRRLRLTGAPLSVLHILLSVLQMLSVLQSVTVQVACLPNRPSSATVDPAVAQAYSESTVTAGGRFVVGHVAAAKTTSRRHSLSIPPAGRGLAAGMLGRIMSPRMQSIIYY
jgi:hypothetical protein